LTVAAGQPAATVNVLMALVLLAVLATGNVSILARKEK